MGSIAEAAQAGRLSRHEIETLAHAGAAASLGLTRREALWQASAAERDMAIDRVYSKPLDVAEKTDLFGRFIRLIPRRAPSRRGAARAAGSAIIAGLAVWTRPPG